MLSQIHVQDDMVDSTNLVASGAAAYISRDMVRSQQLIPPYAINAFGPAETGAGVVSKVHEPHNIRRGDEASLQKLWLAWDVYSVVKTDSSLPEPVADIAPNETEIGFDEDGLPRPGRPLQYTGMVRVYAVAVTVTAAAAAVDIVYCRVES